MAALPFANLHLGAGAHSDADNVGLGQRYISYRNRQTGDSQYGNAIEPVQDAGQVYDSLMQRINVICSKDSNQPGADTSAFRAALEGKESLIDFRLNDIAGAKRALGMDSLHAKSSTAWSTVGAKSKRPRTQSSPGSAPARAEA